MRYLISRTSRHLCRRIHGLLLPLLLLPAPACDRALENSLEPMVARGGFELNPLPARVDRLLRDGQALPAGLEWAPDRPMGFRKPSISHGSGSGGPMVDGQTPTQHINRTALYWGVRVSANAIDLRSHDPRPGLDFAGRLCDAFAAPLRDIGLEEGGGQNLSTLDSILRSTQLLAMNGRIRVDISVYLSRQSRDAIIVVDYRFTDPDGVLLIEEGA